MIQRFLSVEGLKKKKIKKIRPQLDRSKHDRAEEPAVFARSSRWNAPSDLGILANFRGDRLAQVSIEDPGARYQRSDELPDSRVGSVVASSRCDETPQGGLRQAREWERTELS